MVPHTARHTWSVHSNHCLPSVNSLLKNVIAIGSLCRSGHAKWTDERYPSASTYVEHSRWIVFAWGGAKWCFIRRRQRDTYQRVNFFRVCRCVLHGSDMRGVYTHNTLPVASGCRVPQLHNWRSLLFSQVCSRYNHWPIARLAQWCEVRRRHLHQRRQETAVAHWHATATTEENA